MLQSNAPDNDLLLYWPIHDLWADQQELVEELTVHRPAWLVEQPVGRLARRLWDRGFCFDYVSDRQIAAARGAEGRIVTPGGGDAAVVVPQCRTMPLATLRALVTLAESSATVVLEGDLPHDVPGFDDRTARRAEQAALIAGLALEPAGGAGLCLARLGDGRLFVGDVERALDLAGVRREPLVDQPGMLFVRRRSAGGRTYFIVNDAVRPFAGWLPLAAKAAVVDMLDPMSGRIGVGESRPRADGTEVRMQLPPRAVAHRAHVRRGACRRGRMDLRHSRRPARRTPRPVDDRVRHGRAATPRVVDHRPAGQLGSWTTLGDTPVERFAGTARHTLRFDAPFSAARARLDLGRVHETARIRLNGRDLGTLFCPPFAVVVEGIRPRDNVLEVEVTNLAANRIRDLDRRRVAWKSSTTSTS